MDKLANISAFESIQNQTHKHTDSNAFNTVVVLNVDTSEMKYLMRKIAKQWINVLPRARNPKCVVQSLKECTQNDGIHFWMLDDALDIIEGYCDARAIDKKEEREIKDYILREAGRPFLNSEVSKQLEAAQSLIASLNLKDNPSCS